MKLGELFVELGVKSGGAINALTGFAFKFNNVKDLVESVSSGIDGLFGGVIDFATGIDKTSQELGVSAKSLQEFKLRAEQAGVPVESIIGDLKNLNQIIYDTSMNKADDTLSKFLNMARIDPRGMNTLQLYYELLERISSMPQKVQYKYAKDLGISADSIYLYKQSNIALNDNLKLTDRDIDSLERLNRQWVHLGQTIEGIKNTTLVSLADTLGGVIDKFDRFLSKWAQFWREDGSWKNTLKKLNKEFVWIEFKESDKNKDFWEDLKNKFQNFKFFEVNDNNEEPEITTPESQYNNEGLEDVEIIPNTEAYEGGGFSYNDTLPPEAGKNLTVSDNSTINIYSTNEVDALKDTYRDKNRSIYQNISELYART